MEQNRLRKYYSWLFIILAIFIILSLIRNCFFSVPESDLYVYSYKTRIFGLIAAQKYWYMHWSGRIIPTFVLSIGELFIRNIWLYQLLSLVIILFFYWTVYSFVKKCFVFESKLELNFAVAVISLTITQMFTSISSSFYWLPASITYTVPMILSFWSLLFIFSKNQSTRILGFILLFLLMFFNEIIDLLIIGFFFYLVINNYHNKELKKRILIALLIAIAGTIILYTAPGNFERKSYMTDPLNLFQLIFYANKSLLTNMYHWLFGSPILLFLLLLSLTNEKGIQIHEKIKLTIFKNKALLYAFIYCSLILPYLLMYKLTGSKPADRITNIISCVFLLSVIFVFIERFINNRQTNTFKNNPILKYAAVISTLIILYGFNDFTKNISLIVTDATAGKGETYYNEYREQLKQLEDSKSDTVFVREIDVVAPTISYNVMNSDTSNYIYSQFCLYYNKKKIILK